MLEKARATGNYVDVNELGLGVKSEGSSHDTDSSDNESSNNGRRMATKKRKV